jgi:hypothetical protein
MREIPPQSRFPQRLFVIAIAVGAILVVVAFAAASVLPANVVNGAAVSLGALATLTLAVLTAVLLWANWQVVRATNNMANATRDEADATLEEARATTESTRAIQEQIEAASRPVLVVVGSGGGEVSVRNLGPGPGLNCIYFSHSESEAGWVQSDTFNIRRGGDLKAFLNRSGIPVTPSMFGDAPGPVREVVCCEDVAGRAFRFRVPYPVPDIWRPGEHEEDWASVYRSEAHRKR